MYFVDQVLIWYDVIASVFEVWRVVIYTQFTLRAIMLQYTGHPKVCNIYSSSWKVHIRSSNLFVGAAKCDVNNVCQERAF